MTSKTRNSRYLEFLENVIRSNSIRSKINSDSLHELKIMPPGPSTRQRVAENNLKEWWLIQYVLQHYKRLGFTAIQGPFDTGPDFRVKLGRQWHMAEVEVHWRNYLRHKHHLNDRFDICRFLIVLADDAPSEAGTPDVPPDLVYIDREHFADWFHAACVEYARTHQPESKINARLSTIADMMQGYWVEICPDQDRALATCPDCDLCPYFGGGSFQEATSAFAALALRFAEKHCKRRTKGAGNRYDLQKIDEAHLKTFVDNNPH